jgi:hypothetical protein
MMETTGPQIVWLRIGNSTNPALFRWLDSLWANVVHELRIGQGIVEVSERAAFNPLKAEEAARRNAKTICSPNVHQGVAISMPGGANRSKSAVLYVTIRSQ